MSNTFAERSQGFWDEHWRQQEQRAAAAAEHLRVTSERETRQREEQAGRAQEAQAKAHATWRARRAELAEELDEARRMVGMIFAKVAEHRGKKDYARAQGCCENLAGAESYVALVEADLDAHNRNEPGRVYR
jgi:hypothetical protein